LIPKFEELLEEYEIPFTCVKHPLPEFTLYFEDGQSTILIRSAENYKRLVGHNLAWFGVDEVDTIKKDVAWHMWRKLQARLRAQAPYVQGFTTSTPEGYNFMYEFWVREISEQQTKGEFTNDRRMITSTTYDNQHNLAPGYIDSLLKTYPKNLIISYLMGEFVNLLTGNVYYAFDRKYNTTNKTIEDFDEPEHNIIAPLHIGVDFNINKTCGIVHCIDSDTNQPYAVDEITGQYNTEALIKSINQRYTKRKIYIYPDASGNSEKTNASQTDLSLLRAAKFIVRVGKKNPLVRNRINSMNAMFLNGEGVRRYYVNINKCRVYTEALETQGYGDDGKPDKLHNQDHPVDAAGYLIHKMYPITSRQKTLKIVGF